MPGGVAGDRSVILAAPMPIVRLVNDANQKGRLSAVEILAVERTFGLCNLRYLRNLSDRRTISVRQIKII